MSLTEDDSQDADISAEALKALAAAQERARLAGHVQVLVRDGKLIRIEGESITVLKTLHDSQTVPARSTTAKS